MPLRQLHAAEALALVEERQRPVPDMPSSQVVQPAGQAWHEGPKNASRTSLAG
jgi:hypothetical protein